MYVVAVLIYCLGLTESYACANSVPKKQIMTVLTKLVHIL